MENFPNILESIKDLNLGQIKELLTKAKEFKTLGQEQGLFPKYSAFYPYARAVYGKKSTRFSSSIPSPFTVAIVFKENSTRTQLSFQIAALNLGARFLPFEGKSSSMEKGEDIEQSFLTLKSMGINLCIYRTPHSRELERLKQNPPLKIVNAGDGHHQHPSQALLDVFTMMEHNLPLEGKTISIVGDCLHSRVCHSLMDLLPYFGAKILLSGPEIFLPAKEVQLPLGVERTTSIDEAIDRSDAVYLLRVQKERHGEEHKNHLDRYHELYGVSYKRLKKHKKFLPVFHAGPANIGMELDQELIYSPSYMGHSQVEHAIYMRMSILDCMMNQDSKEFRETGTFNGDHFKSRS